MNTVQWTNSNCTRREWTESTCPVCELIMLQIEKAVEGKAQHDFIIKREKAFDFRWCVSLSSAYKSHNFFSVSILASLLPFAFDLLHTTWSHLSPGLTHCPQNSFNLPNPLLSPNVTVIQHVPPLCSLSLLVSLSACLRDFRLTPFVFWCAFFYFRHFTLVHKSLRTGKTKNRRKFL